jgi:hypothetical protein
MKHQSSFLSECSSQLLSFSPSLGLGDGLSVRIWIGESVGVKHGKVLFALLGATDAEKKESYKWITELKARMHAG